MLLFRSDDALAKWCSDKPDCPGATLPLKQLGALAAAWYVDRAKKGYRGRSPAEAMSIFESVGLDGAFWELG